MEVVEKKYTAFSWKCGQVQSGTAWKSRREVPRARLKMARIIFRGGRVHEMISQYLPYATDMLSDLYVY